jgi:hypothetical protein
LEGGDQALAASDSAFIVKVTESGRRRTERRHSENTGLVLTILGEYRVCDAQIELRPYPIVWRQRPVDTSQNKFISSDGLAHSGRRLGASDLLKTSTLGDRVRYARARAFSARFGDRDCCEIALFGLGEELVCLFQPPFVDSATGPGEQACDLWVFGARQNGKTFLKLADGLGLRLQPADDRLAQFGCVEATCSRKVDARTLCRRNERRFCDAGATRLSSYCSDDIVPLTLRDTRRSNLGRQAYLLRHGERRERKQGRANAKNWKKSTHLVPKPV